MASCQPEIVVSIPGTNGDVFGGRWVGIVRFFPRNRVIIQGNLNADSPFLHVPGDPPSLSPASLIYRQWLPHVRGWVFAPEGRDSIETTPNLRKRDHVSQNGRALVEYIFPFAFFQRGYPSFK